MGLLLLCNGRFIAHAVGFLRPGLYTAGLLSGAMVGLALQNRSQPDDFRLKIWRPLKKLSPCQQAKDPDPARDLVQILAAGFWSSSLCCCVAGKDSRSGASRFPG